MMDASNSAVELCSDVTSSYGGGGGGRATSGATVGGGGGGSTSCATSKGAAPSSGVTSTVATGRFISRGVGSAVVGNCRKSFCLLATQNKQIQVFFLSISSTPHHTPFPPLRAPPP